MLLHKEAFRQGLRALGYVEGQNLLIEARYADGRSERLPDLAAELRSSQSRRDCRRADHGRSSCSASHADHPHRYGLRRRSRRRGVRRGLARPGGISPGICRGRRDHGKEGGVSQSNCPQSLRAALLTTRDVARAAVTETEAAGRTLGVRVTTTVVSNSNEVEHAFSSIRDARVGGIVVGLALRPYWKQILHLARQSRLPTVSGPREFVEAGGLMAYGPDYPDLYRRAATYVDKILKGPIRLTSLSSSQPSSSWSSTPRPPRHWA